MNNVKVKFRLQKKKHKIIDPFPLPATGNNPLATFWNCNKGRKEAGVRGGM